MSNKQYCAFHTYSDDETVSHRQDCVGVLPGIYMVMMRFCAK